MTQAAPVQLPTRRTSVYSPNDVVDGEGLCPGKGQFRTRHLARILPETPGTGEELPQGRRELTSNLRLLAAAFDPWRKFDHL